MTTPPPSLQTFDQAENTLFADTISCELALPAKFQPGSSPARLAATRRILYALSQVEELRQDSSDDELRGPSQRRIDAKLDLVLALVARLVRVNESSLPLRPIRWSHRGIRLELGQRSGAPNGAAGTLSLQPADWLPENIEFPVTIVAEIDNGNGGFFLWLRFSELGAAVDAALERHLFRLHRRQAADARRPRD